MRFKKGIKFAALGIAAVTIAPVMAACGGSGGGDSTTAATTAATTTAASTTAATTSAAGTTTASGGSSGGTKTITDNTGRTVEVPEKVNSVIGLNNGLRYLCYLGCVDKVVGVEQGEIETDKEKINVVKAYGHTYKDTWQDKPIVGEGGSGGYTPYEEEIINCAPDVIIAGYSKEDAESLQNKTGIPVVAINSGTLFGDDYDESLEVIGEVMGVEDRADAIIDFIDGVKDDMEKRTKDVPDADKPTVYTGAVSFKGGHGIEGTYSNFPIFTVMNANDVCKGMSDNVGGVTIDKEKVLDWNPDIIFLDPNNKSYVKEDYDANPDYYKQLKAFENGDVYTCIGYNWYHTNIEVALADTYYVASILYPEQFKDVDPIAKAKEIFKFFLDNDKYYDDLEAAGMGFGKIDITK